MRHYWIGLIALLVCSACSKNQSSNQAFQRPDFSADSAYAYIEHQLSFGPRVPNSQGHTDCVVYLVQQLHRFGAEIELQKGTLPDYSGRPQAIINIIAHLYSATPDSVQRQPILLCAHYDTRPWCDEEEEYDNRFLNVPGANDGASGVGVLLEVARQLQLIRQAQNGHLNTPIDIVLFDVEDMGTPSFYTGMQHENTWCLGSQLFATNNTTSYQFGILLDMVGAPGARFPHEYYSRQYAENYQEMIWRNAQKLGYAKLFVNDISFPIVDDHYYLNQAGIPCIDIIHYDSQTEGGFPSWWHTREDDLHNIDCSTLQAVGEVTLSCLNY